MLNKSNKSEDKSKEKKQFSHVSLNKLLFSEKVIQSY